MRRLAICQRIDDHAESTQTPIDLLGLLECLATRARFVHFLRACQVDEV